MLVHLASFKGFEAILKLLLKYGVDFNAPDRNFHGATPLHLAARGGHIDTFQFLANLDLDFSALDAKGDDIFCYASSSGSLNIFQATLNLGIKLPPKYMH